MTKSTIDDGLALLLADYQVFYQKMRSYHWNVTGPLFFGLHEKFEELYNDAALKVDEIAERLAARANRKLPATLKEQLELARLAEDPKPGQANDMVHNVIADLGTLNTSLRAVSADAAGEGDVATANLLEGFADEQEKTAWMFRAFVDA